MTEITLADLEQEVLANEALINETNSVGLMFKNTAFEVIQAAESNKVKILTDYDADGITSAYIMEKLVRSINPHCEVEVRCNDRRGSYGLSPDIQGEKDTRYIVCDMGSNQLELARERLGSNVIILDHHLIESDVIKQEFASNDNKNLCNPHCFNVDDCLNAQYCAAGLAYRTYQETQKLCKEGGKTFYTTPKQDNTVLVMACIGTATDMVDVFDLNGYNRKILKDGLAAIDNADEDNLDFIIGNVLARCGTSDGITAHQLAFNTGAFLNSASRMSEIYDENGAQRMYNALTGDENISSTYHELDTLHEHNKQRKELITTLINTEYYSKFVQEERFGYNAQNNIAIYQLPDNVPAAFAGLVASKLTEATDKAVICVTYSDKKGCFTGSGRNSENNQTALKDFIDKALAKEKEYFKEENLQITYGGHEDAIGISSLNDIIRFAALIDYSKDEMKSKDVHEKSTLAISIDEITAPETLSRLQMLEPTGIGFKIPPVQISGMESYRDKLFKSGRSDWKTVRIKDKGTKTSVDISDWSYSPEKYPQTGKKGDELSLLAEIGISDYKGQHIELSAKFDRQFLQERQHEAEQEKVSKSKTIGQTK